MTLKRLASFGMLVCVGIVPITAAASPASATSVPAACSQANIFPWASMMGDGTAGTIYYELELSNIGTATCTLVGFPSVWAINETGNQVGLLATHDGARSVVTLAPLGTAHVDLGVIDSGALCSGPLDGASLRVVPPGFPPVVTGEQDTVGFFPLQICPTRASMHVSAVEAGTGIPGHSS